MDELDIHQPIVTNLKILKEYRNGLAVAKFLSWLRPNIAFQIYDHVLGADMIPSPSSTFAHALRVSTGVPTSVPD